MAQRSRYIMLGGFLGAGKTTSILKFADWLAGRGLKVGLITNDQGAGLVDTALSRAHSFPTEEIAGGCFCCRFNSLVEAAAALSADPERRPDVFLAEPVGSCTDLVATVALPLQQIYGDAYRVAPMSVVVDPVRCARVLGIADGKKFSENVRYIYRKQLEEAELIAINKIDLLDTRQLDGLKTALAAEFPAARVFEVSARDGRGLDAWFEAAFGGETAATQIIEVDYARYGEGEALLGWLNGTVRFEVPDGAGAAGAVGGLDGNALLEALAFEIAASLERDGSEVAHLKMTLTPVGDPFEIAAINLTRGGSGAELSHRLSEPLEDGELLLNLRAEADPDALATAVRAALDSVLRGRFSLDYRADHLEHFRPGQPVPTHRVEALA